MWLACRAGDLNKVKLLVEEKVENINCGLKYASSAGQLEVVKYLVEKGADVRNDDDYSLRFASYWGRFNVVKYLVENGANIHAENDTPLIWASQSGHFEIFKFLVEKGANIHAKNDDALYWVDEREYFEIAKFLVGKGINKKRFKNKRCLRYLNFIDKLTIRKVRRVWRKYRVNQELLYTCGKGNLQSVKSLVENGVDMDNYVLTWTCHHDRLDILEYLLGKERDIEVIKKLLLGKCSNRIREYLQKKYILLYIQNMCYNDVDIFTYEPWEELDLDVLKKGLIFLGKGPKKHCLVCSSLLRYINLCGNINPYTRESLTRDEISKITNGICHVFPDLKE